MDFRSLLQTGEYVLLDGAMGTMLQGKGMPMGAVPEMMNLLHPEWLVEIHRRYIEAGARVVYANTFGASPYKAQGCGHSPEELIAAGVASCWSPPAPFPSRKPTRPSPGRCGQGPPPGRTLPPSRR